MWTVETNDNSKHITLISKHSNFVCNKSRRIILRLPLMQSKWFQKCFNVIFCKILQNLTRRCAIPSAIYFGNVKFGCWYRYQKRVILSRSSIPWVFLQRLAVEDWNRLNNVKESRELLDNEGGITGMQAIRPPDWIDGLWVLLLHEIQFFPNLNCTSLYKA